MISLRNKISGMMLGIAVGDALGMPLETWTRSRIKERFINGVRQYETPSGHKYFADGIQAGTVTDDTQLSLAVMRGLIEAKKFCLDTQVKYHIAAMKENTAGWGKSTVEAITRLSNGVHWSKSGKTSEPNRGTGNGVPMRVGPIAAYIATLNVPYYFAFNEDVNKKLVQFSAMTHYSQMSAMACLVHTYLIHSCLDKQPEMWQTELDFYGKMQYAIDQFKKIVAEDTELAKSEDDLERSLHKVLLSDVGKWDNDRRELEFGGGSCYVLHSLPYTYSYFVRNPFNVSTLFDIVEAGGDTDSNASMAGAMLGALNGTQVFESESHLISGLKCYDEVMYVAEEFCDVFEIEK